MPKFFGYHPNSGTRIATPTFPVGILQECKILVFFANFLARKMTNYSACIGEVRNDIVWAETFLLLPEWRWVPTRIKFADFCFYLFQLLLSWFHNKLGFLRSEKFFEKMKGFVLVGSQSADRLLNADWLIEDEIAKISKQSRNLSLLYCLLINSNRRISGIFKF